MLPPPRTNISFKAHIIVLPCSMTVRVYAHNLHTTYTQHNTLNNGEHKSRRCMGGDRDRRRTATWQAPTNRHRRCYGTHWHVRVRSSTTVESPVTAASRASSW